MPRPSLSTQLALLGWSLLLVSLVFHVVVFTRVSLPAATTPRRPRGAPAENAPRAGGAGMARYDAVIVGAGWAGLRAAQEFLDANVTAILVLEAGGYVGGRSKTVNGDGSINDPDAPDDGVPIEAGSEWLYDHNGMGDHLNLTGLTARAPRTHPKAYSGLLRGARYYLQTRRRDGEVRTREVRQGMNANKERVLEALRALRKARLRGRGREDGGLSPQGQRLRIEGDESWGDAIAAYKRLARSSEDDMYVDLLEEVARIEYTCDSAQMSLRGNDLLDAKIPSTTYMGARGVGFGNVAARYGARFSSKIRLHSPVRRIHQYQDDGREARVDFVRDGRRVTVAARTVVVTASLGVLKAGSIAFEPVLPRYKREAIEGMGFGVVNKCAMYWNDTADAVWPSNKFWFKLMGAADARWTSFFNPSSYKGVPTLTAWIGGRDAVAMERRTDDEVLRRHVLPHLRAMFPGIRRPDRTVVTRWHGDPHFRGTYSYQAAHRDWQDDAESLRRRVGRLWFAGEATAHPWHGTTIGAWNSGRDVARAMMRTVPCGDRRSAAALSLCEILYPT